LNFLPEPQKLGTFWLSLGNRIAGLTLLATVIVY
jgi:hypothetical protein